MFFEMLFIRIEYITFYDIRATLPAKIESPVPGRRIVVFHNKFRIPAENSVHPFMSYVL